MSKVYVLTDDTGILSTFKEIKGVITKQDIAEKWNSIRPFRHNYTEAELDDPELLKRIEEEGK